MRLIPSQIDRSILVLTTLYAMALIAPGAWVAMYSYGSSTQAQIFLTVFQAVVVVVSVVAGTRRRIFFAIAAWLSMAISYLVSLGYNLEGVSERIVYLGSGQKFSPIKGEFHEIVIAMLISAIVMFAISFVLSYFFDWFLGRVDSESSQALAEADEQPKKKSGRFRILALLAAPLFFVQLSNNLSRGSEWLAVAVLLLIGFAIACRLPSWKGLVAIVAFAVAIFFTSVKLLALRMGDDTTANTGMAAMFFAGIVLVLVPIWFLVGALRNRSDRVPGWLSVLACLLFGAAAWIYSQYDSGSLLFGHHQFDFGVAKSIRNLGTHPNVLTRLSAWYGGRSDCEINFQSKDGVDDFFETNQLPDLPLVIHLSGMPETVDLSPLEQLTVTELYVRDSCLSSAQLVSLAKTQQATGFHRLVFSNCTFKSDDLNWPDGLRPNFELNNISGGEYAKFFEAIEGLDGLGLSMPGVSNERDCEAVSTALKSKIGQMRLYVNFCKPETAAAIADVEDLSNVTLDMVNLGNDQVHERSYLKLLFDSEARISASPTGSDQLFWDLVFATKGHLVYSNWGDAEPPKLPKQLDPEELRKFHLVYDGTHSGQPITKLFLPVLTGNTVSQLVNFPKLRCLSFDSSWMRSGYPGNIPQFQLDLRPLKGVVELKELYMPGFGQHNDLSMLAGQEKLEILRFNTSAKRFDANLFPKLKHVILGVSVARLDDELLAELAALEDLENLTLMIGHEMDANRIKKTVEGVLPKVDVEILDLYAKYIPDDFAEHCKKVRDQCRAKYLQE